MAALGLPLLHLEMVWSSIRTRQVKPVGARCKVVIKLS